MQYKLPPTTTIGRSAQCDIQISSAHAKVSRQHAQIKIYNNSMYVLYDQSSAGTFVNGKREQQIVLKNGDSISLAGAIELRFANGVLFSSNPGVRAKPSTSVHRQPPTPMPIPPYSPLEKALAPAHPLAASPHEGPELPIPPQSQPYLRPGVSTGYKISMPGALAAIIFFFFPWVLSSCGGIEAEQSGWDLAFGSTVDYGLFGGVQKIPGKPIFFLILAAAFLILLLAYLAYQRGMTKPLIDGIGLIILGILPIIILFLAFVGMQDEAAQYNVNVEYKFGLWAVGLGYLAVIAGGMLNLIEAGVIAVRKNKPYDD